MALAQRNHPSIHQAQRQVTISELQITAAALARKPSLKATVSAGLNDGGAETASVGLSMSQTIYAGGRLSAVTRHMLGLFAGQPGARAYRRHLSVHGPREGAGPEVLQDVSFALPEGAFDGRAVQAGRME